MEKDRIDRICDYLRMVRGKAPRSIAEMLLSGAELEKYEIVEKVGCDPTAVPKTVDKLTKAGYTFATRTHEHDRTAFYKLVGTPDGVVIEGMGTLGEVLDTMVSDTLAVQVLMLDVELEAEDKVWCRATIEGFGEVQGSLVVVPSLLTEVRGLRFRRDLRIAGIHLIAGGKLGIQVNSMDRPGDSFVIMNFQLKSE